MATAGTHKVLYLHSKVGETGSGTFAPFLRSLCAFCSEWFRSGVVVENVLSGVEKDGQMDCPTCVTFVRFSDREQNDPYASGPPPIDHPIQCDGSERELIHTFFDWQRYAYGIRILPLVDHNLESIRMAKSYLYPQNTGDDATVDLIQVWINRCSEKHECFQHSATYYPPRLLDLRTDRIHLRTAEELEGSNEQDDSYATLSHCWGGVTDFLRLSTTNIAEFRSKGISLDDLPKTFLDAIIFCRKLNIQLLWIDSLCILQSGQGSDEDWLRHLTEMRMIYYRCAVNLAADHSPNPHGGLFVDRTTEQVKPAVIMAYIEPEAGKELHEPRLLAHKERDKYVYGDSQLSRRGWVFQERLLSPRIIHFSHDQVFWECAESCQVSETYPEGTTYPATKLDGPMTGYPPAFELPKVETQKAWTANLKEKFCQLVEEFSRRKLTYPDTDKLPAFAGVAEHFARIVEGTQYIAGFYRDHLPQDLLWVSAIRPPPRGPPRSSSNQYWCPSWSWAKLDSSVLMVPNRLSYSRSSLSCAKPLLRIKDISVDLLDSEYRYGRVKDATLTMTAHLTSMHWERHLEHNEEEQWRIWWEELEYLQPHRNERTVDPLSPAEEPTIRDPADMKVTAICFDSVRDSYVNQRDAWFMPITQAGTTYNPVMRTVHSNMGLEGVAGLILQNMRSDGPDCYRRIGTARFAGKNLVECILKLPEQHVVLK